MSDENMMHQYPNIDQRAALCLHQAGFRPKVGGERAEAETKEEETEAQASYPSQVWLTGRISIAPRSSAQCPEAHQ